MKTIGLIGGMCWRSTVAYYRQISEAVKARMGVYPELLQDREVLLGLASEPRPDVMVLSDGITQCARPAQLRVVVHQPVAVIEAGDQPNLLRGHRATTRVRSVAGADVAMGRLNLYPTRVRCKAWRGACGWSRLEPRCRHAPVPERPIR